MGYAAKRALCISQAIRHRYFSVVAHLSLVTRKTAISTSTVVNTFPGTNRDKLHGRRWRQNASFIILDYPLSTTVLFNDITRNGGGSIGLSFLSLSHRRRIHRKYRTGSVIDWASFQHK